MKKYIIATLLIFSALAAQINAQTPVGNGKNFGVAINPFLALFEYGSGEVNIWNISRNSEINIPIEVMSNPFFIDEPDLDVSLIGTGLNYRLFFSETQKGLFAQAGWKMYRGSVSEPGGESVSGVTNSVLFGVGYRAIAKNGMFWGAGINAGRTWGDITGPDGNTISDSGLALDIDFLKFGFAW